MSAPAVVFVAPAIEPIDEGDPRVFFHKPQLIEATEVILGVLNDAGVIDNEEGSR